VNNPNPIRPVLRLMLVGTVLATFATQSGHAQVVAVPPVPSNLKVQAGNVPFLKAAAVGTQNYLCLPSGWTFIGPQATLFVTIPWFGGDIRQQVATHFLTPNPAEEATNRPLWQSSVDSSIVWGKQLEMSTDSNYVDPTAIPWLLLERAGNQIGPAGGTMLSQTTFIQRINTTGGLKPATACTVGAREFVPYTADYVFYRKATN
jgi:Protein of unknown function (DUF3455)